MSLPRGPFRTGPSLSAPIVRAARVPLIVALTFLLAPPPSVQAQSLRGSRSSLDRQNRQARAHDFTYLRTTSQVRSFVRAGYLVPVGGNDDYELHAVSFPFARPESRLFIERLSRQYRAACGERLVVTSLTRPTSSQPDNASARSVHPTGMAMDLRRPANRTCRRWLEETLLYLERVGVVEATRERHPPHYHLAVFPRPYRAHVTRLTGRPASALLEEMESGTATYRVRRADTLWEIARQYGTTPRAIRSVNGLRSSLIHPGQVLTVPVGGGR